MPSQEQLLAQLRILLAAIGAILTTLGVVTGAEWDSWVTMIFLYAGPGMMILGVVWSFVTNTRASLVKKVDDLAKDPTTPVVGVVVANTPEGRELAASIPGNTTVVVEQPLAPLGAVPPKRPPL